MHLDPDLAASWLPGRSASAFRGLLGQAGAAAGHLVEQDVGEGALFLFFGRFRRAARRRNGEHAWEPGSASFHAVFGYLEVDHPIDLPAGDGSVEARDAKAFAPSFPHFHELMPRRVVVYVARRRLSFAPSRPGFGLFRYRDELRLTHLAASRVRCWRLPACFSEVERLTYHGPPASWSVVDGHVELRAASRGQEFVCEPPPRVAAWAHELVTGSELWEPARRDPRAASPPPAARDR